MDLIFFVRGTGTPGGGVLKAGTLAPRGLQPTGTSLIENKRSYNDLGGSYEVSSAS